MNAETIGKKLKDLREARGLTQAQVAEALSLSPMAVSMYETGQRIPRDLTKVRLADFYGETVQSIFYA